MKKIDKFREILRRYGVTKCYVNDGFDFEADEPNGMIRVNVNNNDLEMDIYKLYTVDVDGLVSEEQNLGVWYDDFSSLIPNFNI